MGFLKIMKQFVLKVKLSDGKAKYIAEDTGQFYFLEKKEQASIYESVSIFEAEKRLNEFLKTSPDFVQEIKRCSLNSAPVR